MKQHIDKQMIILKLWNKINSYYTIFRDILVVFRKGAFLFLLLLPWKLRYPLKIDGWKMKFPFNIQRIIQVLLKGGRDYITP